MSEQENNEAMADYESQLEQSEFVKRQAAETWGDAIVNMMGDHMDRDKALLFKQGLVEMMSGGPRFTPRITPMPEPMSVDAEFPMPIFEERDEENGVTRVWDWNSIAAGSTHAERSPNTVRLYRYEECLITLHGEAAETFWKWQESIRNTAPYGFPVMVQAPPYPRKQGNALKTMPEHHESETA